MNEELTNEVLEAVKNCNETSCNECLAMDVCCLNNMIPIGQRLATDLLEERAKPKVWDGAPAWATIGRVCWTGKKHGEAYSKLYHRELPKTRIDEIIDESLDGWLFEMRMGKSEMREILKSALTKYAEELEGKK